MTIYNKDQEYNLKVVNTAGETKEIKYTPNKDMSKPEMIMALKAKYKNFFKLIESKLIESENTDEKSTNRVDYPNKKEESYGETKYEVSSYYGKDFKGLEDSLNTNNYDEVETFIWEKLQNGNTVECTDTETGDRKRYSPETHEYGDETFGIEDYIVESKYDYKKVNKAMSGVEKILKQNGYNLTHDDINLETNNNGEIHVYDKLTGDEVLVVTQDMLRNILTEATLDKSVIVISYGKGTRFPDRNTAIRYYEDCVAGTDRNSSENYSYQNILYSLKSTDKPVVYDIDDDTEYDWWVQKGKPTEDISDELLKAHLGESKDMNEKRTESKELLDGIDSEEYAVNIRDKSTGNFVGQYDCYETYEEAVKSAKKMKLADNETYEIVKIMYDENGDELGVDRVDSKETLEEYLSDKDIKELDEYTDNEIKKMYDDYCSENSECKSFEEWQKENVDSAMINELEYEFFSNRKKTESSDIDEKVVTDGFVGQPLSMLLTYLGDGHDIADKDYDSVVFFPPVDEIDDADNYDLYVQGLSQILNVAEPFDFNDIVIVVNLADYVTANKDTLLDLFEVDGETDEEIMEDLVCRVMPSVISGYTTDNVYKILLSTVKGGK